MISVYYITLNEKNLDKNIDKCYNQFNKLKKEFSNSNILFYKIELSNSPYSYYFFLTHIWNSTDIIIIERDMFVTIEQFKEMINCNYSLICSACYKLQKIVLPNNIKENTKKELLKTDLTPTEIDNILEYFYCGRSVKHSYYIQKDNHTKFHVYLNTFTHKYNDYGCFGFVKIPLIVQQQIQIPYNIWNNLDSKFYELYIRYYGLQKVHNHTEIKHYHKY